MKKDELMGFQALHHSQFRGIRKFTSIVTGRDRKNSRRKEPIPRLAFGLYHLLEQSFNRRYNYPATEEGVEFWVGSCSRGSASKTLAPNVVKRKEGELQAFYSTENPLLFNPACERCLVKRHGSVEIFRAAGTCQQLNYVPGNEL
jgi:hypothetical protein